MDQVFSRVKKNKKINTYNYLSPTDKKTLQLQFEKNPFPTNEEVTKLSEDLSQTEQRILNWFKYQWHKKNIRPQHIKKRKRFTKEQLETLEKIFRKNIRISHKAAKKLAVGFDCTQKQVFRWFFYRRAKLNAILKENQNSIIESEIDSKKNENIQLEKSHEIDDKQIEKTDMFKINNEPLPLSEPIFQKNDHNPYLLNPTNLQFFMNNYNVYQNQMLFNNYIWQQQSLLFKQNMNSFYNIFNK